MIAAPLHGIASAIFIPKVTDAFRQLLPGKIISTGFQLRAMLSGVLSYTLSIFVIERLFNNGGSTSVFIALIVISTFIFGLLFVLSLTAKKKKIVL